MIPLDIRLEWTVIFLDDYDNDTYTHFFESKISGKPALNDYKEFPRLQDYIEKFGEGRRYFVYNVEVILEFFWWELDLGSFELSNLDADNINTEHSVNSKSRQLL